MAYTTIHLIAAQAIQDLRMYVELPANPIQYTRQGRGTSVALYSCSLSPTTFVFKIKVPNPTLQNANNVQTVVKTWTSATGFGSDDPYSWLTLDQTVQLAAFQLIEGLPLDPCCCLFTLPGPKLTLKSLSAPYSTQQARQAATPVQTTLQQLSFAPQGINSTVQVQDSTLTIVGGAGLGLGQQTTNVWADSPQLDVDGLLNINGLQDNVTFTAQGLTRLSTTQYTRTNIQQSTQTVTKLQLSIEKSILG